MNHVTISKFETKNKLHQTLSELSKTLHDLKTKNDQREVEKYEKEVDQAVGKLFGLE